MKTRTFPRLLRRLGTLALIVGLAACAGNVSRAARELGVSRGLIYRHLKQASAAR